MQIRQRLRHVLNVLLLRRVAQLQLPLDDQILQRRTAQFHDQNRKPRGILAVPDDLQDALVLEPHLCLKLANEIAIVHFRGDFAHFLEGDVAALIDSAVKRSTNTHPW